MIRNLIHFIIYFSLLIQYINVFTFGFMFFLPVVFQKIIGIDLTPGLSTTVLLISFFAGVQLFSIGLLGEYLGRVYLQVQNRPDYIVDKVID